MNHRNGSLFLKAQFSDGTQDFGRTIRQIDRDKNAPIMSGRNTIRHQNGEPAFPDRPLGCRADEHILQCLAPVGPDHNKVCINTFSYLTDAFEGLAQHDAEITLETVYVADRP